MAEHFIELDFTIPMSKESQDVAMDAIAIVEETDVRWDVLCDEGHEAYGKATFENLFPGIQCGHEPVRAMALAFAAKAYEVIPDDEFSRPLTQLFVSRCDEGLHVTNDEWPYLEAIVALIEICQEHLDTPRTGFTWHVSSSRAHNEDRGVWIEPGEEPAWVTLEEYFVRKNAGAKPSAPSAEPGPAPV